MTPFQTNEACINILTEKRTLLANCEIHLVQDTVGDLNNNTTLAQLTAAEATYTGYAMIPVVAPPLPYLVPGNGGNLQLPTVQFQPTGAAVTNLIRGFWLETAGGDVWLVGRFDADIPMAAVTDAIPLDVILHEGNL